MTRLGRFCCFSVKLQERGTQPTQRPTMRSRRQRRPTVRKRCRPAAGAPPAGCRSGLAQQGKVQGGGTLLGGEHQRGHALIHQGLHILNGGAEGGGAVRHVQRQDPALLPGGVKDLTAQQALDGVPGFGGLCLVSGDQHDVALDGVTLRCAVAAVGGVGLAHGNVAAVQRDLTLKHHAFVLRGR